MNKNAPIGIFDSGIGGLSVMLNIHQLLPTESLFYVADSLNVPYGSKPPDIILDRSIAAADFLINKQGAKAIVIACNTATAISINELRAKFSIPIIGMEPAVKPASEATIKNKVGVLATSGTLHSAKFSALLENHSKEVEFYVQPCPGLVDLIDYGSIDSPKLIQLIKNYCQEFKKNQIDTIVLGCTHYVFIKDLIKDIMGPEIKIIDTGFAVANQVNRKLIEFDLQSNSEKSLIKVWTNRQGKKNEDIINRLLSGLKVNYKLFTSWP